MVREIAAQRWSAADGAGPRSARARSERPGAPAAPAGGGAADALDLAAARNAGLEVARANHEAAAIMPEALAAAEGLMADVATAARANPSAALGAHGRLESGAVLRLLLG